MPSFEVFRHDLAQGFFLVSVLLFLGSLIAERFAKIGERTNRVALGLAGGMMVLTHALPHHLGDNWIILGVQLAAAAVMVGAQFLKTRFRPQIAAAAALVVILPTAFSEEGGLGSMLFGVGFGVAILGLIWLMKLSDKHFPSPEARGAADVLRLRAERRAELRNDHA